MSDSFSGSEMCFQATLLHLNAADQMLAKRTVLNALTMLQFHTLVVSFEFVVLKGSMAKAMHYFYQFDSTQQPLEELQDTLLGFLELVAAAITPNIEEFEACASNSSILVVMSATSSKKSCCWGCRRQRQRCRAGS